LSQKQHVALAVESKGARQHVQHVLLALAGVCFERHDVARAIVEHAVDAKRCACATELQRGSVAHVGVPQGVGRTGLPAQPRFGSGPVAYRDAIEAVLPEQLAHGAWLDRA
jgi:hypothetical protein